MTFAVSPATLNDQIGSLLYIVTAVLAMAAAWANRGSTAVLKVPPVPDRRAVKKKRHSPKWAMRASTVWVAIGVFFIVLAGWRLANGDEWLHLLMREEAYAAHDYGERRRYQLAVIVLIAAPAMFAAFLAWPSFRALRAELQVPVAATLILLGFSLVRVISFHPIDSVIYHRFGPLNFNRIFDMGLTALLALMAAVDAIRTSRRV